MTVPGDPISKKPHEFLFIENTAGWGGGCQILQKATFQVKPETMSNLLGNFTFAPFS